MNTNSCIGSAAAAALVFTVGLGVVFAPVNATAADAKVEPNRAFFPMFAPLPDVAETPTNEITDEKVALGRQLFNDKRFSKNHDRACASCHELKTYGVDHRQFAEGHAGHLTGRNSPTVYNAALHISQFWDGRSPNVEKQALGPVLSPVEMAMPDGDAVVAVMKSIEGYVKDFKKVFPDEKDPLTFDNFGIAIAAFERKLLTPGKWDEFLKGDETAFTNSEIAGYNKFVETGCVTCHNGVTVGGQLYQKLGLVKPWPGLTDDGRYEVTKNEAEKGFFKVPSLRNIARTGPYTHDGSIKELPVMVRMMARHQLGRELSDDDVASIVTFLTALTGELPRDLVEMPELPESGPNTPKPDPS